MINSIYEEPFWLDAMTEEGSWRESVVRKDGVVVARLPYVYSVRNGMRFIEMPPFTPLLGPYFKIDSKKNAKRISNEKDLIGKLILQLPDYDYFKMKLHWSFTNWLPFYWNGFSQTTRYTYQIKDVKNLNQVWDGFDQKIRTDIRKAEKCLSIVSHQSVENFHEVTQKTYIRQGIECPYSFETLKRLIDVCLQHNCGKMYFASDKEGNTHAAILIVWDHDVAYYLVGGGDPEFRNSGANSYLLWHAIQDLSQKVRIFDFEGSMVEPIERFFRGFGGVPVPYHEITRSCPENTSREILRKLKGNVLASIKLVKQLAIK